MSYINIMEIGNPQQGVQKFRKKCQLIYSPDVPNDIPIITQIS